MSYIVNWSSTGQPGGKPAINVAEKVFDATSTSLVLTGKGLKNYGLYQQENFLKLLENFASSTPPSNPTHGQMWYDTTRNLEFFWNGTSWDNQILRSFSGPNPPPYEVIGQLWYDTANRKLNVWTGIGGWSNAAPVVAVGLSQYSPDPDASVVGFASRINRLVGSPIGSSETDAYGWGQKDLVPVYTADGALSPTAIAWENDLPSGLKFPAIFDNNAWAIALSRLRKARRQVGLPESAVSRVGFIDDSKPGIDGNLLADHYNNLDYGFTPYEGTVANIRAGFAGEGLLSLGNIYGATLQALSEVEQYRFSLGPAQTQILTGPAGSKFAPQRTSPTQSLSSSPASSYVHAITLTFSSKSAADAYFNAGGQIQFTPVFNPVAAPTALEIDWKNFIQYYSGFTLDYKGIKTSPAYATPTTSVTYHPSTDEGTSYIGYYDLTGTLQTIFIRDVLDLPGAGLYSAVPPENGGIIVRARKIPFGSQYRIEIQVEYYLRFTENDNTDTSLTGTLISGFSLWGPNNKNVNVPGVVMPDVANAAGTFVTAP